MIEFGCWAESEAAFWASWVRAGICTAPYEFAAPYAGNITTTSPSWCGTVVRNGAAVPGWHCNVRVWGALEESFTSGLQQTDENGALLSIWQRTRAAVAFGLTDTPPDAVTGFPQSRTSADGVKYADAHAFANPANVWA